MKTAQDFINDIPETAAHDAHRGTSWVPEKRAISEREGYAAYMAAFYNEIFALAGEDRQEEAEAELERYRLRYLRYKLGALGSRSRIVSSMVAGPSNFPARRMEKLSNAYQKRVDEWLEWDAKIQGRIRRRFDNSPRPIRTGEANAIDELSAKLTAQQAQHDYMVGVNKLFRNRKLTSEQRTDEIRQLARRLGVDAGWIPTMLFERFELANSSGRIKTTKLALEKARSLANQATTERMAGDVRIVNNVEEDRLQVFFPERVSREIYKMLSSHGFRHSRRNECFQAYRGSNANYWLEEILKEYAKDRP